MGRRDAAPQGERSLWASSSVWDTRKIGMIAAAKRDGPRRHEQSLDKTRSLFHICSRANEENALSKRPDVGDELTRAGSAPRAQGVGCVSEFQAF